MFSRYVALGDSFTEGVGDPAPSRPNGLRGWADRVAEVLAAGDPGFGYANLAIRGRKLDGILAEQLAPALALRPDLVTIYAGANDVMRPRVDLDGLMQRYDVALGRLSATGARLLVWTAFDPGGSATYRLLRGRWALYNEMVRELVDRHDATLVDYWRMRDYRDWRLWDVDRMHMSAAGHQLMAIRTLDVLDVPHHLRPLPLDDGPLLSRRAQLRENAEWTRTAALPWVRRRLTGRSSGDTVTARYPDLTRPAAPM